MTPKERFLQNASLALKLRAVTHELWFLECLDVVKAQFLTGGSITGDLVKGAMLYERLLLELAEEAPAVPEIEAVLHHDIDDPRKRTGSTEQPTTPAP